MLSKQGRKRAALVPTLERAQLLCRQESDTQKKRLKERRKKTERERKLAKTAQDRRVQGEERQEETQHAELGWGRLRHTGDSKPLLSMRFPLSCSVPS